MKNYVSEFMITKFGVPTSPHEAKARVQAVAAVSKPGLTLTQQRTTVGSESGAFLEPKQCRSNLRDL